MRSPNQALPIGRSILPEDLLPQSLDERALDLVIGGEEMVDDLVARHGRCAVAAEALERARLSGTDAAGDRNRDRTLQLARGLM